MEFPIQYVPWLKIIFILKIYTYIFSIGLIFETIAWIRC